MSSITIETAKHTANNFKFPHPQGGSSHAVSPNVFFRHHPASHTAMKQIIGTSYTGDTKTHFISNGFVRSVMIAYSGHHDLIIRPDDIWISILSQLSFYINANAETFRSQFVAHEGSNELVVIIPPTSLEDIDWDFFSDEIVKLMDDQLVDKELKDWIMPTFSTTTRVDSTVSAILMMATLKQYFSYTADMRCGIPHVTLEGTKADYQSILSRLDKLDTWDTKTRAWGRMLKPILKKLVAVFDGDVDLDFWGHIVSERHLGSGGSFLGGWITAFCAISENGVFTAGTKDANGKEKVYKLEGVVYPIIKFSQIPAGHAEVNVKIIDPNDVEYAAAMTAGNMGLKVEKADVGDSVRSVPIWACYLKNEEKAKAGTR